MNMLRKNRLTKIIILSLLIIFGFQATGLATVMDLRAEGDIAATDVLLAMLSGFAQGIVMKPGWGVYQVFAYTYLVPVASREISDAAGIDNAYARAALQMGLSMGVTTFFDLSSASKEALKETTEKASQVLAEEGVQAAEKVWDDAIKVATDPVAKGVLTQAKDTFMQSVKVVSSKGDSLRNIALAAEQSVFKEFGIVSANRFVASLQKGVQGAFYGAGRQYLYENIKKHSKDLAGFLSTTGSALFAQLVGWVSSKFTGIVFTIKKDASGRGILVAEKKEGGGLNVALKKDWQDFKHEFKILATGQAIETAGEMAGVKEAGVLFSAGITNVMRAKQEKKDTSTMDQLLEGLKLGAISVGLQNVSLKTKSPVHGAYFNLFASEILKTALIRNTNDSQEIGRGAFFIEGLKKSVTSATADTMSMGRATPWINDAKTFDLDWNNPNDVFFMARYYDYISDLNKYGRYGITTAIANQMISSIHYQTVYNARQILDSALNRAGLVKNDPLKQYYVYLSSPSCRQITTQYYQAKGAVENLLREKEELIKVAANKTERVPDRSKFDKAFGDEKKLAQIKNELAEKKTRTEAEQELFLAIEDYMDLKKVVSTKPLGFGYGSKEHIEPMREKLLAKQREDIELNKDEKTVLSWIKALDSAGQGNILLVRDEKLIDFVTMRDYSEAKARKNIELIQEYLPKVSKKAEILADKKATEVAGEPPSTEEFSKHLEKYTKLDYPQAPEEELLTLKVPKTVALSEQETNLPVDPVERWFKVYGDEYGRVKSLKQDELMNEVLKDYFKNNKLTNVDVFRPIVGGPARYEDRWVEKPQEIRTRGLEPTEQRIPEQVKPKTVPLPDKPENILEERQKQSFPELVKVETAEPKPVKPPLPKSIEPERPILGVGPSSPETLQEIDTRGLESSKPTEQRIPKSIERKSVQNIVNNYENELSYWTEYYESRINGYGGSDIVETSKEVTLRLSDHFLDIIRPTLEKQLSVSVPDYDEMSLGPYQLRKDVIEVYKKQHPELKDITWDKLANDPKHSRAAAKLYFENLEHDFMNMVRGIGLSEANITVDQVITYIGAGYRYSPTSLQNALVSQLINETYQAKGLGTPFKEKPNLTQIKEVLSQLAKEYGFNNPESEATRSILGRHYSLEGRGIYEVNLKQGGEERILFIQSPGKATLVEALTKQLGIQGNDLPQEVEVTKLDETFGRTEPPNIAHLVFDGRRNDWDYHREGIDLVQFFTTPLGQKVLAEIGEENLFPTADKVLRNDPQGLFWPFKRGASITNKILIKGDLSVYGHLSSEDGLFKSPIRSPYKKGDSFGSNRDREKPGELGYGIPDEIPHTGIDMHAPAGTPIRPSLSVPGRVIFSGDLPLYGNSVIIQHPDDYYTLYAHNKENLVQAGEKVTGATIIATVGHSGNASKDMLHYEVFKYKGSAEQFLPSVKEFKVGYINPENAFGKDLRELVIKETLDRKFSSKK